MITASGTLDGACRGHYTLSMRNALVPPDDPNNMLGPAMKALRPQHRLFVIAMFENGDDDATAAARSAGYVDNGNGAISVQAHRLAHREDIKAAMQEEAKRRLTLMLPIAERAVREEAMNPQSRDRLRAASMIFNRAGVPETTVKEVNVNIVTREEKIAEIRALAEVLGKNADELLGAVTDAEFEEVDPYERLEF